TANSNWGGMVNQYGLSEVRFLYIPVWAREPNPTPGAADVSVDTVLDWRAGREAAGHDVYLSTDEQAVIDGTAPVVTVTEPSYASSLDLAANYYWRIDEVNDAETPAAWPGDVWNFSTQEYIVVDDFESYNDIPVGEEGSNLVYMAWIDGFDNPSANGSTMGYVTGASLETGNVHAGGKSVPLAYDNTSAGISEVVRTFTPAQDWTAHGVKTLSLWFAGDGANVAGQLYVKVNGVQVNYDGDAANLTVTGWQPWNVDLTAINTNLSNVTSMTIGIQGPGATGTLLLDDIRLYSYDRELITPAEPGAAGLQAHYEFEGNTNDSSGNACHGTAAGNPFFGEGKIGQAMSFDGLDDVVEVPHSAGIGFNDSTNLTVTLWAKPIKLPRLSWTGIITKNRDIGGSAVYGIWINNSNQWHFHVGGRKGNANIPGAPEPTEEWHFVAMTHDVDATTLRGYVDGLMIYENTNSDPAPLTAQSPLWIGGSQSVTEFYPGQLDDVRIYDRTLTQEEIAWLAGRTQPFDKPF
ncbi:MAG TPA: LamG domain-containing protein, partial [Phycisphaerales bacterium]|nr:LamG domain-containing protein [Phycisphaerales bacterium]